MTRSTIRIGADVGGTFTDVVALDDRGGIWTHKVPSTPPHFERAVLAAFDQLIPRFSAADRAVSEVAHGTTVATNAVLEHRGARTALITTRGFRDVLELRRVRAPQLYDLFFDKPRPLIERRLRLEVDERVAADGEVLVSLEERELERLAERLEAEGVEAVAVCLLHAYAFPQHELRLGQYLRERLPEVPVSLSSEVLPERRIAYSPEYEVGASLSAGNRLIGGGGELIRAPSIDIAEVGAGGGSIAFLDQAGGLRVGPRSAGAVPGPACYQRGGLEPTLTDANVVLGYIRPGDLADGEVSIDAEAAQRAVHDRIAAPLGLDLLQAAEGIHRIANAHTMRALRAVSTERGRDPRDFALMAFGGAGPIHAAGLARDLAIGQVVVPPLPGLFSALGLLCSGVEHHDVRSCLLGGEDLQAPALEQIRGPDAGAAVGPVRRRGVRGRPSRAALQCRRAL